jgi:hypothetical protein
MTRSAESGSSYGALRSAENEHMSQYRAEQFAPHRKGGILAGSLGRSLHPLALEVPKQLAPFTDQLLISYPLATLIMVALCEALS